MSRSKQRKPAGKRQPQSPTLQVEALEERALMSASPLAMKVSQPDAAVGVLVPAGYPQGNQQGTDLIIEDYQATVAIPIAGSSWYIADTFQNPAEMVRARVNPHTRQLEIVGTEGADRIILRRVGDRISIDGFEGSISASAVRSVYIQGLGGNDVIRLDSESAPGQQALALSASVDGGDGNDFIVGGAGVWDTMTSEFEWKPQANSIFGGAGHDELWGNTGWLNFVSGGDGNDIVHGGALQEYLNGGQGQDVLVSTLSWMFHDAAGGTGSPGGVAMIGGPGKDRLYLGDRDFILPEAQLDELYDLETGEPIQWHDTETYNPKPTGGGGVGAAPLPVTFIPWFKVIPNPNQQPTPQPQPQPQPNPDPTPPPGMKSYTYSSGPSRVRSNPPKKPTPPVEPLRATPEKLNPPHHKPGDNPIEPLKATPMQYARDSHGNLIPDGHGGYKTEPVPQSNSQHSPLPGSHPDYLQGHAEQNHSRPPASNGQGSGHTSNGSHGGAQSSGGHQGGGHTPTGSPGGNGGGHHQPPILGTPLDSGGFPGVDGYRQTGWHFDVRISQNDHRRPPVRDIRDVLMDVARQMDKNATGLQNEVEKFAKEFFPHFANGVREEVMSIPDAIIALEELARDPEKREKLKAAIEYARNHPEFWQKVLQEMGKPAGGNVNSVSNHGSNIGHAAGTLLTGLISKVAQGTKIYGKVIEMAGKLEEKLPDGAAKQLGKIVEQAEKKSDDVIQTGWTPPKKFNAGQVWVHEGLRQMVNPAFGKLNCINCSVVVDALLKPGGGKATAMISGAFEHKVAGQIPQDLVKMYGRVAAPSSKLLIETQLLQRGHDARGIVFTRMHPDPITKEIHGHAFNVVNHNGQIYYIDGQNGLVMDAVAGEAYFQGVAEVHFLRTD